MTIKIKNKKLKIDDLFASRLTDAQLLEIKNLLDSMSKKRK